MIRRVLLDMQRYPLLLCSVVEESDKRANSHVKMVYLATVLEVVSPVIIRASEKGALAVIGFEDQADCE